MSLDANSLIAGLLVSSVGFVLFSYGRKLSRPPQLAAGLVLLVFPYFVSSVLAMLGIALALCVGLYLAVRAGY